MAGTVEFLGTRITDASSITNWGVSRVDGGGGQSWTNIALNTTEAIQGGSCVSAESTANSDGKVVFFAYDYNAAAGSSLDFSSGGADEGQLLWVWCKLLAPQPSGGSTTLPGVSLGLSSAAGTPDDTDTAWWTFYGSENYPGSWVRLVLDPRKVPTASGASFDLSNIQHIGMVGTTTTAKGSVEVGFVDAIDLGSGVRYYGDFTDDSFDELVADDQDNSTNKYGVIETLENTDTVVQIRGILEIGSGNSQTSFQSNDKVVVFDAPQYIATPGSDFANALNDDFPKVVVIDSDTAYTSGTFGTKVGTGDDSSGRNGVQFLANNSYDYNFIIESGVDAFRFYGSTLKGFNDNLVVWSGNSTFEYAGSFFDNNGQIEFVDVDSLIRNCTFLNASGDSAMLWTSGMDIANCSFLGNRNTATNNGAGIEHPESITVIYNNLTFADNDFDIYFSPASSGDLIINATNGANPGSTDSDIRRGNANSDVQVINTITLTLDGIIANSDPTLSSEVRVFTAGTTTELAGVESVSPTGGGTGKFDFAFEGGDPNVDIRIFNINYRPVDLLDFELPAANTSIPIQQIFDRNYDNP